MNALASRPAPARHDGTERRFRALLDNDEWDRLPEAVQRRFSRKLEDAQSVAYVGEVTETRMTWTGRVLGQLTRLVGAPLPLSPGGRTAAAVVVTEDEAMGGQLWTRIYGRAGRFPQVIHSAKRFSGPTGLEECVGLGVGMTLTLGVANRALVFRSRDYFVQFGSHRLRLPAWLTPGVIEVVHREERRGRFSFTLGVTHRWFGEMIRQTAFFSDPQP